MSIKDRVIAIIAEQAVLEPSDVTLDSTLEDLGIDSLGWSRASSPSRRRSTSRCRSTPMSPRQSDFDISSVAAIVAGIETLIAEQNG